MTESPALAPRRAVILGASNVFRNLSTVTAGARSVWGSPLELLIAAGHGRSYGMWNWVLGYSVPGIIHCGLWDALAARTNVPTAALITDVGNDLLYGASPEVILGWIETCLARLRPICEQITIAELPLTSVTRLGPRKFAALSRILFPRSKLTLSQALEGSKCLNVGLLELAKKFSVSVVAPCDHWYGIDPIHIRRRHTSAAWHSLLSPWNVCEIDAMQRGSTRAWLRLRLHRTHVQRFLNREYHTPQPVIREPDGSTISFY